MNVIKERRSSRVVAAQEREQELPVAVTGVSAGVDTQHLWEKGRLLQKGLTIQCRCSVVLGALQLFQG